MTHRQKVVGSSRAVAGSFEIIQTIFVFLCPVLLSPCENIKHSKFNIGCLCLPLPLFFMISLFIMFLFPGRVQRLRRNMSDYSWQVLAGRSGRRPRLMLFFYSPSSWLRPRSMRPQRTSHRWGDFSDGIYTGRILRLCLSTKHCCFPYSAFKSDVTNDFRVQTY